MQSVPLGDFPLAFSFVIQKKQSSLMHWVKHKVESILLRKSTGSYHNEPKKTCWFWSEEKLGKDKNIAACTHGWGEAQASDTTHSHGQVF